MKVLNDTELKALLTKLKSKFALANHTHTDYANSTHSHSVVSTTAAGFAPIRGNTTTKFLRDDGTWATPPDTKYTHPTSSGNKHIPSGGSAGQILRWSADGTAQWGADNNTTYTEATQSKAGLMSKEDKSILSHFTVGSSSYSIFPSEIGTKENCLCLEVRDGEVCLELSEALALFYEPIQAPSVKTSGSDYAKYYEWLDGNLENEDRRGLFVTLDGEKIKIANVEDDFILGVVSAAPGFVENAYETEWQGKYIKDIYGERITQEVEVPESTDAEDNTIPATIKTEYVLNPEYNENEKYIPRSQRPEWTYVGLTGELVVNDDGTCEVNGYCSPSVGGIATKSDKGYRVLARLDETHIKVLIK